MAGDGNELMPCKNRLRLTAIRRWVGEDVRVRRERSNLKYSATQKISEKVQDLCVNSKPTFLSS